LESWLSLCRVSTLILVPCSLRKSCTLR
jgi:hypothetical protein